MGTDEATPPVQATKHPKSFRSVELPNLLDPKILEVDGLELLLFKHQDPLPLADKFQVTNYEVTRF